MAVKTISFKVPNIADAYAHPLNYELTFSLTGWSLSEVDETCALLITTENAKALLAVMEEALRKDLSYEYSKG